MGTTKYTTGGKDYEVRVQATLVFVLYDMPSEDAAKTLAVNEAQNHVACCNAKLDELENIRVESVLEV